MRHCSMERVGTHAGRRPHRAAALRHQAVAIAALARSQPDAAGPPHAPCGGPRRALLSSVAAAGAVLAGLQPAPRAASAAAPSPLGRAHAPASPPPPHPPAAPGGAVSALAAASAAALAAAAALRPQRPPPRPAAAAPGAAAAAAAAAAAPAGRPQPRAAAAASASAPAPPAGDNSVPPRHHPHPPHGHPPPPPHAHPNQRLRLEFGAASLPHPEKASTGGEDAFEVDASLGLVALADGVGGWAESGVDAAAYARGLVAACAAAARAAHAPAATAAAAAAAAAPPAAAAAHHATAALLLPAALRAAVAATTVPGSATVVLLRVDAATGSGRALNCGDSGFALVRAGAVALASPPQAHSFNQPYQLGCLAHAPHSDTAADAQAFEFAVLPGDALVVASDGLWDNVTPAECALLVAAGRAAGASPADAAHALARLAFGRGGDELFDSPFAVAARGPKGIKVSPWRRLLGLGPDVTGGKLDDTTVVVVHAHAHAGE